MIGLGWRCWLALRGPLPLNFKGLFRKELHVFVKLLDTACFSYSWEMMF